MEHFISVCAERGNRCVLAGKVRLDEAMTFLSTEELAGEKKEDCVLIFNGYRDMDSPYSRNESSLDKFSTIFIDCDNPQSDPHLADEFKEVLSNYEYYLYETYSSSAERPKFRAIIPMDESLPWTKNAKAAIFNTFNKFADPKASWFYSPTRNRLNTIVHHEGKPFPARLLKSAIEKLALQEQMETTRRVLDQMRVMNNPNWAEQRTPSRDSWRKLPSVKYCLGGLTKGERDQSISKACYAMDKLGYREFIHEFLDELIVPQEFKNKFKHKYR